MIRIERATAADVAAWAELRAALWPSDSVEAHAGDIAATFFVQNDGAVAFVAREGAGMVGFAEAALRHDYVNGCETSPVAFLEGIYVGPAHRRQGIASALCAAVADWGKAAGCTEFASDAPIDNIDSQRMHAALGFAETERVVFFRRPLV